MKRKENGFQRRTLKDIKRVRFLEPIEPNLISSEKLRKTIFPGYDVKERVENGIDLYRLTRVPSIKKLRRLQAAIKGWYTRKVVIPKKKENEKLIRLIAYQMLYKKIDQVFMNEAIFEAMTEIKQKDFHTYTIKSQRRTYRYADFIITNVVKKFAQEALDQMLRFDVKKILRNRQMSRIVDPIELICYELIGKVSKETSKELVSVSIDEVTQEYKTNCTINRIVRQNIIPLSITELVKQSAHECIVETMFDDIIERLAFELIEPLSVVCMQEEKEKADKENLMRQEKLNKKRALNDVLRTDIETKLRTVDYELIADLVIKEKVLAKQVSDNMMNEYKFNKESSFN